MLIVLTSSSIPFKYYYLELLVLGNGMGKSEISQVMEPSAFRHEFDN